MADIHSTPGNLSQELLDKEAQISRLNRGIETREKQLADMANMLAEMNQQLSESRENNKKMSSELEALRLKLDKKDNQLRQELKDKELMFSKLQTLERENDKLNTMLKSKEKPASSGGVSAVVGGAGGYLLNMFKGNSNNNHNKPSVPQIETSKVVIAQEKALKKQQLGEQRMEMEEIKTKKGSYDDQEDDILQRIRNNLDIGEGGDNDRERKNSLTDQINTNTELSLRLQMDDISSATSNSRFQLFIKVVNYGTAIATLCLNEDATDIPQVVGYIISICVAFIGIMYLIGFCTSGKDGQINKEDGSALLHEY